MRIRRKITKKDLEKNNLTKEEKEILKAFYGIDQIKVTDISELAKITKMDIYNTERLLIGAVNKIKGR